jgi:hypothetical protein
MREKEWKLPCKGIRVNSENAEKPARSLSSSDISE